MEVLLLTVFISVMLAVIFILFFVWQSKNRASDPDRDSLMPLDDEAERKKESNGK